VQSASKSTVFQQSVHEEMNIETFDMASESGSFSVSEPRRDTVQDVGLQVMRDPFAAFNLGSEQELQYLSDAKVRLTNCDFLRFNSKAEMRKLVGRVQDSPKIYARLEDMSHHMQQRMADKVFPFRNKVWDMARTLCEALLHSRSGNQQLAEECNNYLDVIMKDIADQFQKQYDMLAEESKSHHLVMLKCVETAECAESDVASSSRQWMFFSTCAGLALTEYYMGNIRPELLVTTGFTTLTSCLNKSEAHRERTPSDNQDANRIRPYSHKVGSGVYRVDLKTDEVTLLDDYKERVTHHHGDRAHMKSGWTIALATGGVGLAILGWRYFGYFRTYRKKAESEHLLSKASALQKFDAHQNQRMWEGMNMSVENLQASVHELQQMNVQRKERRDCVLHDIACKLFAMNIAVDEYIFLLSERDYFPPNFSVRNALQPARYDRIKEVMDAVQVEASRPDMNEPRE
jgi:hypothetical protein